MEEEKKNRENETLKEGGSELSGSLEGGETMGGGYKSGTSSIQKCC